MGRFKEGLKKTALVLSAAFMLNQASPKILDAKNDKLLFMDKTPIVEIKSSEFKKGPIDTWLSLDESTAIRLKGEMRNDTIFVDEVQYSKQAVYSEGGTVDLFGDSLPFKMMLEQDKLTLTSQKPDSRIRETVFKEGEPLEVHYPKDTVMKSSWTAKLSVEQNGKDTELDIGMLRAFDEPFALTKENKMQFEMSMLNLKLGIDDKGPGILIEMYALPVGTKQRIGRSTGFDNMGQHFETKDTVFNNGLIRIKINNLAGAEKYAQISGGDLVNYYPFITVTDMICEIKSSPIAEGSPKLKYASGYVWTADPKNTSDSAYFYTVTTNPSMYLRRDEGPGISKVSLLRHHYGFKNRADWAAYYHESGVSRIDDVTGMIWMIDTAKYDKAYLMDEALQKGYIRINGTQALMPESTAMESTTDDFLFKVIRSGDPKKLDSVNIWDLRPEYRLVVSSLSTEQLPYEKADPTSVHNDQTALRQAQAYPNPVYDILTIEREGIGAARLEITNNLGQTVYTDRMQAGDPKKSLQVSDMPDGMYFIRVVYPDGEVEYQKFIKIHK